MQFMHEMKAVNTGTACMQSLIQRLALTESLHMSLVQILAYDCRQSGAGNTSCSIFFAIYTYEGHLKRMYAKWKIDTGPYGVSDTGPYGVSSQTRPTAHQENKAVLAAC